MKPTSLYALAAVMTVMMSACSGSNPTSSDTRSSLGGSRTENPGILARLSNPSVEIGQISSESYNVMFVAGASGASDSEPMVAVRTITSVDFEFYGPGGAMLSNLTARDVYSTGVVRDDQVASLTVVGETKAPIATIRNASYVVAVVHGRNGETLIRRADIPRGN